MAIRATPTLHTTSTHNRGFSRSFFKAGVKLGVQEGGLKSTQTVVPPIEEHVMFNNGPQCLCRPVSAWPPTPSGVAQSRLWPSSSCLADSAAPHTDVHIPRTVWCVQLHILSGVANYGELCALICNMHRVFITCGVIQYMYVLKGLWWWSLASVLSCTSTAE